MTGDLALFAGKLSAWKDEHHDCDCRAGTSCGCVELREIIQSMDIAAMPDEELRPAAWMVLENRGVVDVFLFEHQARQALFPGAVVQPLYARPVPGVSRGEVARIIEPQAFETPTKFHSQVYRHQTLDEGQRDALERADQILALLSRGEG